MQSYNLYGTWTLYLKEVKRFIKVYNQTLIAPLVTSLLFLAIFSLSIGDHVKNVGNVPFVQFVASGLIIMAIVQNAFANTSSAFIMGKVLGTIIDYLMPPLSASEMILAMVMAGVTRGIAVGLMVTLGVSIFVPFSIHSYFWLLFYTVASSMLLALLGMFAGIFSDSFDSMAAITSYIITPLAFLSGTFYSVHQLPKFWYKVTQFNPFFYMIDGFRYSMTGHYDSPILTGAITLVMCNIVMWIVVYIMILRGYRIKT